MSTPPSIIWWVMVIGKAAAPTHADFFAACIGCAPAVPFSLDIESAAFCSFDHRDTPDGRRFLLQQGRAFAGGLNNFETELSHSDALCVWQTAVSRRWRGLHTLSGISCGYVHTLQL